MEITNEENEKFILFQSTHHSIKAKNIFSKHKIEFRMQAVPPVISSDCGSAIAAEIELDALKSLFDKNNILVEAVYSLSSQSGKKNIKRSTVQIRRQNKCMMSVLSEQELWVQQLLESWLNII